MRVLLVRPAASGGLAAHVDHELSLLRGDGYDVEEAPVRIGERPRPAADLRTVRVLREVLRGADTPVAVHAHGLRAGALAALSTPHRGGHRLVVTLHNRTVGSRATRTVGAGLLRVLCRRADTVLAVSPDLAEDARRAGARDVRHAIVPVPSRTSRSTDAAAPDDARSHDGGAHGGRSHDGGAHDGGSHDAGIEALVVARLAPQKGLHDLLDAAALLREGERSRGAGVRVLVAGDGPLHGELAARIRAERLPVELLGRREDVPALLAACDLVVSAARWEGQPVWLQEALLAGRAIVATDAGGTRWVTGDAARLVPVGDAAALAAAVTALIDTAPRRTAEAASRQRARDLPTDVDLLSQLHEVFDSGARDW
ncbi:glycosyltransferase [Brachybacterium sp. AOP43-C2-M15]|uniref:glycosyltransferase n=1 Tax=Brachybacterium sp. AOP43-C2-M15 TaxID=3457661 RepID=UPI004034AE96